MESLYFITCIIIIFIFIYSIKKYVPKKIIKKIIKKQYIIYDNDTEKYQKKNCKIDIMTPEKCYNNSVDLCPMSSYKQCTNNYPTTIYPPISDCKCNSFSLELCNLLESDACSIKRCNINNINQYYTTQSINNPRVNIYNTATS